MKLRRKVTLVVGLFSLSLGLVLGSPWLSQSQAQANFDACTDITDSPPIQQIELVTQLSEGERTYGLFRVFDGRPEPEYAVQSVDGSGACRVDYWNPTGQPISISDMDTIPSNVADTLTDSVINDRD